MWVLTKEEEDRLLVECEKRPQRKKYLKDLVLLALNTGMRQSELFNLKKLHVKLKKRYLKVADTKTHEDRYVPINETAAEILKRYLAESPSE
jgi:integrase